ncbi:MAG: GIY-YIG nuclease family protein [Chloroflexi bacterium]|nr:GIY-YIG nuclease family protein [Chloroflexota bacterium]
MSEKFSQQINKMPELLKDLKSQPLLTRENLTGIPQKGIYVFYENNKALYVGRSNRIKLRIQEHSRPSSMHNSASFAFRLAREELARHQDIPKDATRGELEKAPGFDSLFYRARDRVARMKIRVIGIDDQVTQALFEIYAALTLDTTKYNDFGTH